MTIKELRKKGIHLTLVDGDKIRASVPCHLDSPELKQSIRDNKDSLIAELKKPLEEGDRLLEIWRRDSIPVWRDIRDNSLTDKGEPDVERREYAKWMLEDILHDGKK